MPSYNAIGLSIVKKDGYERLQGAGSGHRIYLGLEVADYQQLAKTLKGMGVSVKGKIGDYAFAFDRLVGMGYQSDLSALYDKASAAAGKAYKGNSTRRDPLEDRKELTLIRRDGEFLGFLVEYMAPNAEYVHVVVSPDGTQARRVPKATGNQSAAGISGL